MHTPFGFKSMRIAPAKLRHISDHDLFQGTTRGVANEHEVPQDIAQLVTKLLPVDLVPLEHILLHHVYDLARFSCQAKCSQYQLARRIVSARVSTQDLSNILLFSHSHSLLISSSCNRRCRAQPPS